MDLANTLGSLAGQLFKLGAPQLGTMIGTAVGGPAGAVVGGLAGKAIEGLAANLGTPATPEAVKEAIETQGSAPAIVARVEASAAEMIRLWEIEAQRGAAAQAAEVEKGFGAWQFWRGAWQGLIIAGWSVLLLTALFGGNAGVRPLLSVAEMVSAWGSVTLTWLAVFNGGHTLKEIAPLIGFGRKGVR
jgi:hypothetical protein